MFACRNCLSIPWPLENRQHGGGFVGIVVDFLIAFFDRKLQLVRTGIVSPPLTSLFTFDSDTEVKFWSGVKITHWHSFLTIFIEEFGECWRSSHDPSWPLKGERWFRCIPIISNIRISAIGRSGLSILFIHIPIKIKKKWKLLWWDTIP